MATLFGYGTLTIPEVVEALTGRSVTFTPATAQGFARYRLKGRIYPGIVEAQGETTPGVLYTNLDSELMRLLNAYEDEIYQTAVIPVRTNGHVHRSIAYIIPSRHSDHLSRDGWDPEQFMDQHGRQYINMCRNFRRCYEEGRALP
jgi:gamma-glutamylcyclotransferase (GGCT)/AIG2-like uncharacterized protein YtfP